MTEREALPPLPTPIDGPAHSTYTPEDMLAYGRTVWQASRQQALEEAERVCGNQIPLGCSTSMVDVSRSQGVRACIDAIRSLSHPTGGKE